MDCEILIVRPTRHDFPEDWAPDRVALGLYSSKCRLCGASIFGDMHRRTCRVCVGIAQRAIDGRRRAEHGEVTPTAAP